MTTSSPPSAADAVLSLVIKDQSVIEYDRRKPLAPRQRLFLDHMDRDMDAGISLDGERIEQPDLAARARFMAVNLVQAAESGNDSVAAATCAWLALRLPELKQVRADRRDGELYIELVFDRPHVPTQPVQFVRRDPTRKPH